MGLQIYVLKVYEIIYMLCKNFFMLYNIDRNKINFFENYFYN